MELIAYGEDSLTLWALQNKLKCILKPFEENIQESDCKIFYRPSFGRGGRSQSNFGEFDFLIVSNKAVYLGESKWDNFGYNSLPYLKEEQKRRHKIFNCYIEAYFENTCLEGYYPPTYLFEQVENKFEKYDIKNQTTPGEDCILSENIISVLQIIDNHIFIENRIKNLPIVQNVLLYFYNGINNRPTQEENDCFKIIPINYSGELEGNFIKINI
jgi:hypothetical protein